jgi:threonine aldolase
MRYADFRSDTVTRPSEAMRRAMAEAEVGDDVFGEDPTVNRLETRGASLLGKEAALFLPSGTQSNLVALLTHLGRGDEYIAGQDAHCYKFEGGGAAALGSAVPQPIEFEEDGSLDLGKVAAKIKADDFHHARTRLLCLENTHDGKPLGLEYHREAFAFAKNRGLALHLDGARLLNAAVKLGIEAPAFAELCDSVSLCLSKGLGAPVGSLLCGGRDFISHARRWRKVVGGGMRQAGILAAAGLYALEHNVDRLAEDHENAAMIAERLRETRQVEVLPGSGLTNMVFLRFLAGDASGLAAALKAKGVLVPAKNPVRLVTHLDLDASDCDLLVEGIREYLATAG